MQVFTTFLAQLPNHVVYNRPKAAHLCFCVSVC